MSEEVKKEKGGISVATEHIFPVIKKWLYSEKEIFLREIVSNACDAETKLKRLESLGKYDLGDQQMTIRVTLDKDSSTITVSDDGIGMNADEIKKYICSIALSGALDFIEQNEKDSSGGGIIGHFGLGFYSAFMVSSSVDIISRSIDGSPTVLWSCEDGGNYTISETDERPCHGTDIVMHIDAEEGGEYLNKFKLEEILEKYCSFMPFPIFLKEKKDDDDDEKKDEEEKPINDTSPLWLKNPSDAEENEYSDFYKKVFRDYKEPLFHIHINADYPLNFKGILYFPKITNEYESLEGQVKLYYNQVFVADNIKEVIPEYLLMLRGVLDCPELPLNVSRSYLQNNGYVKKISSHIVKKTSDKINGLFGTDRENYEKMWKDLKIFCEYGCIKDPKFYERIKGSIIFETTGGKYVSVDEYLEGAKGKNDGVVYYATDKVAQASYISLYESEGIEVVILDKLIDTQFIGVIENDKGIKFMRIDSDIAESLKNKDENGDKTDDKIGDLFKKVSGNESLKVVFESLKDGSLPAIINISEQSRRMNEMMKLYGMSDMAGMPGDETLVINSSSELIKKLEASDDDNAKECAAKQIYSIALMCQRTLSPEEMKKFVEGSFDMIAKTL